jgi:DNA modification methylase
MTEIPINKIIQGDCIDTMRALPDCCVDCCITSPPYWGLRDYGIAGQIGLEKTPEEFIAKIVEVFRQVKRLLKSHGTLWLNLGDTYCGSSAAWAGSGGKINLKHKDLCGIPWRVALALQEDGWYLRQDIIWHKPNPMPESVRDRCTKAHEYVFLLSKSPRYYFDAEAIKEKSVDLESYTGRRFRGRFAIYEAGAIPGNRPNSLHSGNNEIQGKTYPQKNKRSVWTIPTEAFSGAHFATFPRDLVRICILAGTSQKGCCSNCGAPWQRILEPAEDYKKYLGRDLMKKNQHSTQEILQKGMCMEPTPKTCADYKTVGWQATCTCQAQIVPAVVLDPFMGSGTTALMAYELGRQYVGCELNPDYIELDRSKAAKAKYPLLETA